MTKLITLPSPHPAALARTEMLTKLLHQQILQQGAISFAQFMQQALYHPLYGYYCANDFRFGKQGDFTTAPEISPLFAACFANLCEAYFKNHTGHLLELGAGSGKFAFDLLSHLSKLKTLPVHYYIFEISHSLQQQQKEFFLAHAPQFLGHITWLTTLPQSFDGIIIANEVFDALPFHCFAIQQNSIQEKFITLAEDTFKWKYAAPSTPDLIAQVEHLQWILSLADGYESEINLQAPLLIQELASCLTKGMILIADYGYGQAEYYHPERQHGTLTCFYQHHRHEDPLLWPGLQDITAHVNFTQLAEAAMTNHCAVAHYTTQASFLLGCGLLDLVSETEAHLQEVEKFALHQAVKRLTFPTEMGERVKIMALCKQVEMPSISSAWQDRRRDL